MHLSPPGCHEGEWNSSREEEDSSTGIHGMAFFEEK